jgi:hypothetical protein
MSKRALGVRRDRARAVLARLEPLLACFGDGAMQLGRQIGDFDYPAALAMLKRLF